MRLYSQLYKIYLNKIIYLILRDYNLNIFIILFNV